MITYYDIIEAQNTLVELWGEDGMKVIEECAKINPFNDSFDNFLTHCSACGGNWGGMLLTGIKKLYPTVYNAIPKNMGSKAFLALLFVLVLCGIDSKKEN